MMSYYCFSSDVLYESCSALKTNLPEKHFKGSFKICRSMSRCCKRKNQIRSFFVEYLYPLTVTLQLLFILAKKAFVGLLTRVLGL